jgi:molybdate transport system substrate-binding protein
MRFATLMSCIAALLLSASLAQAEEPKAVTVYAAASLTNALQDIGKAFESAGGAPVKFSFAASSLLAKQIEAGAEADIFVSADGEWMDYLEQRKLLAAGSRHDLLSNRLVLISPASSTRSLKIERGFRLAEALGDSRLALADPASVPAGKYAKAALAALGVWDQVSGKLAPAENVRVALAYVARGEAAYGIVYETDAKAEPKVRVVDVFPADTHPRIVYPIALMARSTSADAKAFLAHVTGERGAGVFTRYGFGVIPPNR